MITKIIKISVICFFLYAIQSCGKEREMTRPEKMIDKEKMIELLVDVNMAEASIQTFKISQRDSIAKLLYGHIFRIHEVEEFAFYESMEWYVGNPKIIKEMYKEVQEKLKAKEQAKK